jgi:hypothetical protein
MSIHLRVVAELSTPCIGVDSYPMMLDGPLAWAYAQRELAAGRRMPPMTAAYAPDFPLPLQRWEEGGTWGWCTSRSHLDVTSHTVVEVRRKPALEAAVRYGTDRKWHIGTGPYKARDTQIPATWVQRASWDVEATDRADLEDLLGLVTHLGARHRNGYGAVRTWTVTDGTAGAWRDRPMPDPNGAPIGIRAPHWHHSRQVRCTC